MYEFDIEEIKETIHTFSDKEKLEYLSDKETEIMTFIEELQSYADEIEELKDEIEDAHSQALYSEIHKALQAEGYDIPWDNNGEFAIKLGETTVTIIIITEQIYVFFTSDSHQLAYREQIGKLLPEFKQDGNFFSLECQEGEIVEKAKAVVKTIYEVSL